MYDAKQGRSTVHMHFNLSAGSGYIAGAKQRIRVCLVREIKIFGCHIDAWEGCWEGFLDTNKKTNYRTHQETARRI